MAILKIKGEEFELKFSIMLDKMLNKNIELDSDKEAKRGKNKLSGGIQKVLPELIDMDVEMLAKVFEVAMKNAPKDKQIKATLDEILDAIDEQMNEDGDASVIFGEVFEAINESAFSRNELKKYAENMQLVKYMKSEEISEDTANMMLSRMQKGYKKITGKELFETETTDN